MARRSGATSLTTASGARSQIKHQKSRATLPIPLVSGIMSINSSGASSLTVSQWGDIQPRKALLLPAPVLSAHTCFSLFFFLFCDHPFVFRTSGLPIPKKNKFNTVRFLMLSISRTDTQPWKVRNKTCKVPNMTGQSLLVQRPSPLIHLDKPLLLGPQSYLVLTSIM